MRLSITTGTILAAGLLGAAVLAGTTAPPADGAGPSRDRLKRGEYLTTIMDCAGCHTPGVFLGKPDPQRVLGGSEVGFQLPGLGTFFPPNLTPDPETGLGKWTEAQIVAAIRKGVRPDGRILAPIMPYQHYAKLTDEDAQAIAAFLKSLKPVSHKVPAIAGPSEKPQAPYLAVVMPD
jgi:mono/diheme cytochrome c family protein